MKILNKIVREEFDKRSNSDRRKKVLWILTEYYDKNTLEPYRKSFEFPKDCDLDDALKTIPKEIE